MLGVAPGTSLLRGLARAKVEVVDLGAAKRGTIRQELARRVGFRSADLREAYLAQAGDTCVDGRFILRPRELSIGERGALDGAGEGPVFGDVRDQFDKDRWGRLIRGLNGWDGRRGEWVESGVSEGLARDDVAPRCLTSGGEVIVQLCEIGDWVSAADEALDRSGLPPSALLVTGRVLECVSLVDVTLELLMALVVRVERDALAELHREVEDAARSLVDPHGFGVGDAVLAEALERGEDGAFVFGFGDFAVRKDVALRWRDVCEVGCPRRRSL